MVDGLGVGDVGNIVLRDRQHLSEDGIMVVVLTLEKRTNQLLAGLTSYPAVSSMYANPEDLMGEQEKLWKRHWMAAFPKISPTGARSNPRSKMPSAIMYGRKQREDR